MRAIQSNQTSSFAGFVLAGGRSSRMGRDKALLELNGKPLVVLAAERLRALVPDVKVIGSPARYSRFGYPVVEDLYAAQGPLVGLSTGLKNSSCDWNLFLACDLPCVEASLLRRIVEGTANCGAQAVIPRFRTHWEPLCAAYHRSCLPAMEEAIAGDRMSIVDLIPILLVESIPVTARESEMFKNINTEQDWQSVHGMAGAMVR